MAYYRGLTGGRGMGGGGGREARGGLNPPLGLFRLAMSPRSANHRPNMLEWRKRLLLLLLG